MCNKLSALFIANYFHYNHADQQDVLWTEASSIAAVDEQTDAQYCHLNKCMLISLNVHF